MTELIKGDDIRAVKRAKGHVWWCPWCDTSHQDNQTNCTKCGAVRYEAAPVAVLRAVVVPQGGIAPEPPLPPASAPRPLAERAKAKKPNESRRSGR